MNKFNVGEVPHPHLTVYNQTKTEICTTVLLTVNIRPISFIATIHSTVGIIFYVHIRFVTTAQRPSKLRWFNPASSLSSHHQQVRVQPSTSADNMTLLASAAVCQAAADRRLCSSRSISASHWAHSSKPGTVAHGGRRDGLTLDGQTNGCLTVTQTPYYASSVNKYCNFLTNYLGEPKTPRMPFKTT